MELDWICVGWDGDFRFSDGEWTFNQFRGSKWMKIKAIRTRSFLIWKWSTCKCLARSLSSRSSA